MLPAGLGKPLQHLEVVLGLAQAEVALLDVLDVGPELLGEARPQVLDGVHRERQLARVASRLPDAAAVATRAAVADALVALEHDDGAAAQREVVGGRASDDAGADDDDVRRATQRLHALCPGVRHRASAPPAASSFPSTRISTGRIGAREVSASSAAGETPSSAAMIRRTSLVHDCPWQSPMPTRR